MTHAAGRGELAPHFADYIVSTNATVCPYIPVHRARLIAALGNVSRGDRGLWGAFLENPEAIAAEAEAAYARLTGRDAPPLETELDLPEGPTETVRAVRARRVQSFFRAAVLASLITFDDTLRVVLSPRLRTADPPPLHRRALLELEGRPLRLPQRFAPDPAALAYHRERVFI